MLAHDKESGLSMQAFSPVPSRQRTDTTAEPGATALKKIGSSVSAFKPRDAIWRLFQTVPALADVFQNCSSRAVGKAAMRREGETVADDQVCDVALKVLLADLMNDGD